MNSIDITALSQEDLAKLRNAVADIREWLNLKLKTGRCSFGFIVELALHQISRSYSVYAIYDEIEALEGGIGRTSVTKPAGPFRGKILEGLWHKHHFQTTFIYRNLMLETTRPGALRKILAPHFGRDISEVAGQLAHALTMEAYQHRASGSRMTGEWIVFEREPGGHYYLTLGQHDEPDEGLRKRVEAYREADRLLTTPKPP